MMLLYILCGLAIGYLLFTLLATYLVHQLPREPVQEKPDWGRLLDTRITACDGGFLEVWRIEPEMPSKGIILLAHGWSRNRDRMVGRARLFGEMGFTTVIHSARDHGSSSRYRFMNAYRFAQDIEAVLDWIAEPVLLYGHSAGAAGAVIAAHRNPQRIKALFLEGCYAETKKALLSLYRSYNALFGYCVGPFVIFWMDLFYRFRLNLVSPVRLAPDIDLPVLLIHGAKDRGFPLAFARKLQAAFPDGQAELFVAPNADHSSSSLDPDYPNAIRSFLKRYEPEMITA